MSEAKNAESAATRGSDLEPVVIRLNDIRKRVEAIRYRHVYEVTARLNPETVPICNLRQGTPEYDFHEAAAGDIEFLLREIEGRIALIPKLRPRAL